MSFWQIFDRISRLARANSFDGFGSHDDELRRAQELIDEENRRDRMKRSGENGEPERADDPAEERTGDETGMTVERACLILSVPTNATEREITLAYRKKIFEFHPDRHMNKSPGDEAEAKARTQELNLAYALLKRNARG